VGSLTAMARYWSIELAEEKHRAPICL